MKTLHFCVFLFCCILFSKNCIAQNFPTQINPKILKPQIIDKTKLYPNLNVPILQLPDLVITQFTKGAHRSNPNASNSGEALKIPFTLTVKNNGNVRAGNFVVKIEKRFICPPGMDSYFCYEITRVGPHRVKMLYLGNKTYEIQIAGLNPGQSRTFSGDMYSHGFTNNEDNYRYTATADANGQVREHQENNNRATTGR